MNNKSTQEEILSLERKYWKAMGDKDVETAVSLTRFPCVIMGPQGTRRVDEADYRKMMQAHDMSAFQGLELKAPQVDLLSDQTAVISYSLERNGEPVNDISTWVREGDRWLCAFHAENPREQMN